jgi:peptide/nickel transport system substrate-binding protein
MGWNGSSSGSRRGLLIILLVAVLATGLAWGLAGAFGASSSPAPGSGGPVIFRIGITSSPDNLNPWQGSNTPAFEVWHLNWLMLYTYDAASGASRPELAADAPQYSADGLTVTIKLKQGVKWSDGTPFTAKDVVYTYGTVINPKLVAAAATGAFLSLVQNLKGDGLKSVTATDDYTVVLHYNKYGPNISKLWIPILPEHIWKNLNVGDPKLRLTKAQWVGTGPFIYDSDKADVFVKLVKNPNYSSVLGPAPKIDQVIFQTYQESGSMVSDFETGKLATIWDVPGAEFDRIKGESSKGLKAIAYKTKTYDYLGFNLYDSRKMGYSGPNTSQGNPVLLDPDFRHALAWAIDKQVLVNSAYGGKAEVGDSILPPGVWPAGFDYHYTPGLNGTLKYTFDLEKAKSLLDAAGYKDVTGDGFRETKDGKPLVLRMYERTESPQSQKQGQLICEWFKEIGIKTTQKVMSYNALAAASYLNYDAASNYTPDFDMYMWDMVGYEDPGDTLAMYTKDQIFWWNDTSWINPQFDAAFKAQEAQMDPKARVPLVQEAERILYEDVPEVVTVYPLSLVAYNDKAWSGWVHQNSDSMGDQGAVVLTNNNMDSYIYVHPTGEKGTGGSSIWILWIAIAVVVVAGGAIWLVVRGRGKAVNETV